MGQKSSVKSIIDRQYKKKSCTREGLLKKLFDFQIANNSASCSYPPQVLFHEINLYRKENIVEYEPNAIEKIFRKMSTEMKLAPGRINMENNLPPPPKH